MPAVALTVDTAVQTIRTTVVAHVHGPILSSGTALSTVRVMPVVSTDRTAIVPR